MEAKDNPNVTLNMWQPRANNEEEFKSKFLGDWSMVNDAVYTREQIDGMLRRGEISAERAEEMLRMRYDAKGIKRIDNEHP